MAVPKRRRWQVSPAPGEVEVPQEVAHVRRFEYVDGRSAKFWQIASSGTTVTVNFGRLGTKGQAQAKDLATDEAVQRHMARLIGEKLAKGYVEVPEA